MSDTNQSSASEGSLGKSATSSGTSVKATAGSTDASLKTVTSLEREVENHAIYELLVSACFGEGAYPCNPDSACVKSLLDETRLESLRKWKDKMASRGVTREDFSLAKTSGLTI